MALAGHDLALPRASDLWTGPAFSDDKATDAVDASCGILGIPGLSGSPDNEVFAALVRAAANGHQSIIESLPMKVVIAHHW